MGNSETPLLEVEKVDSPTLISYLVDIANKVSEKELAESLHVAEDWKKQIGSMGYDIHKDAISYNREYPTLEALLNLFSADLSKVFETLKKEKGLARFIAYYYNLLAADEEDKKDGKIPSSFEWDDELEYRLSSLADRVDGDNKDMLNILKCILCFHYSSDEEEENKHFKILTETPDELFAQVVTNNALEPKSFIMDFVTRGYHKDLSENKKSTIFDKLISDADGLKILKGLPEMIASSYTQGKEIEVKGSADLNEKEEHQKDASNIAYFISDFSQHMLKRIDETREEN